MKSSTGRHARDVVKARMNGVEVTFKQPVSIWAALKALEEKSASAK